MKVALLLSLLLLATTVLAQDATSQMGTCTVPNSGAPGSNITCTVISQSSGVLSTAGAFTVTSTSPSDSGGVLYAPNPLPLAGTNTSVFQFTYTIGNNEIRLLNFTVQAGGSTISGSPVTTTVGLAITLNSFTQTVNGNPVTTASIYQVVAYTAAYSNRAISWVINYGDGTSDTFAPPSASQVASNHLFYPGNSAQTFTISGTLFDGVVSLTTSPTKVITINPCAIGTNSNQQNTSCVSCLNGCNSLASQRCTAFTGQPPSCTCPSGTGGPDCGINGTPTTTPVNPTGTTNTTGSAGGASIGIYMDNGSRKRSVPSGTNFVFGPYTITDTFTTPLSVPTPAISFEAALVNSNNLPIPPGTVLQFTIDISHLSLLSSTSAGNTIQLLYRQSPGTWVDPTLSCSAAACANIGLPGCKSVTDFTAIFAICQAGGAFAVVQNIAALAGGPTTPSLVTGGSLTSTIPVPVSPAVANQQLPNGKPSAVSPVPVPTPVVLPPNSAFTPPTQSSAGALQPITLVSFAVVTLVLML